MKKSIPLMISLSLLAFAGCAPTTYRCLPGAECYGAVTLSSPKGIEGFGTFVDLVGMSSGDGSITQLIRIIDPANGTCAGGTCWIEVGYTLGVPAATGFPSGGANSGIDPGEGHGGTPAVGQGPILPAGTPPAPLFFWAETPACSNPQCPPIIVHPLANIPHDYFVGPQQGGILSGPHQKVFLVMVKDAKTNAWDIGVYPIGIRGAPVLSATTTKTTNAIFPRAAMMGMELMGTAGANAPEATYTFTGISPPAGPGVLSMVTSNGSIRSDNPPTGVWLTLPSAPSAEGGTFRTTCCNK